MPNGRRRRRMANRSSGESRRRAKADESMRYVDECIGQVSHRMALFAVTRGQWSMIDAIRYVVKAAGGGSVSVWTWTIADYEIKSMEGLLNDGLVTGAQLIVDMSADRRTPHFLREWRKKFGPESVKVCRNHAKIARVWNDDWRFLLRGSMNLNFNPRFEQFDLTEGGLDFDLVTAIEEEMPVLPERYTFRDIAQVTKIGQVFSDDVLQMFGDLSPSSGMDVADVQDVLR